MLLSVDMPQERAELTEPFTVHAPLYWLPLNYTEGFLKSNSI